MNTIIQEIKEKDDKENRDKLLLAYNKLKSEMDDERHSETLRKFKILNKAYDLGIKIYGKNSFSIARLSWDFDMPYTTTKRILALRKANKRTWELIKEKKITAFKVAMVLLQKNNFFQDEIIDLVIKDNLSTFQIKSLKIKDLKDIQRERLKVAVERGFSRSHSAYTSFLNTIERLEILLQLKETELPKSKIPELKEKLLTINKKIEKYLKEVGNENKKQKKVKN